MAPRRSQAAAVDQNEGPSSASLLPELETDRLSQGLATWASDGQEAVKQILSSQTGSDVTSTLTIPISNTLIKILQSEVGSEDVVKCLQEATEPWVSERKNVLWEALVDSVAVLSEGKDDARDLNTAGGADGMEVDGQAGLHVADKGIQVVKLLLVSVAREF